jgi:hypothetical protein
MNAAAATCSATAKAIAAGRNQIGRTLSVTAARAPLWRRPAR